MRLDFTAQFDSISDWSANQRLLTQYLEHELFFMVFANRRSAVRARFAVEGLSWAQRADKISQLSQIVFDSLMRVDVGPLTFDEYSQLVLGTLRDLYGDMVLDPMNFGARTQLAAGEIGALEGIADGVQILTSGDIIEGAMSMIYEHGGHIRNVVHAADWQRLAPIQAMKDLMVPSMFDRLEKGRRYNLQLNYHVEWDEDDGLSVTVECLPCDPDSVLHDEVVPADLPQFLIDHWNALLTMPIKIMIGYCLVMCDEPVPAITQINSRIGEAEWAIRDLKDIRPVGISDGLSRGLLACPVDDIGVKLLRDECLENGEVRRVSCRIDLHRMQSMNLLVLSDAIFELDVYFELDDHKGRPYISGRFGQTGVSRNNSRLGDSVVLVCGTGSHSIGSDGFEAGTAYRGRFASELAIVLMIVTTAPMCPMPAGRVTLSKKTLTPHGIQMMKWLNEYELFRVVQKQPPFHINGLPGSYVRQYILDFGRLIMGFTNLDSNDILHPYELMKCFRGLRHKFYQTGRISFCECPPHCMLKQTTFSLIGLTYDFARTMSRFGVSLSVSDIFGKDTVDVFVRYCTTKTDCPGRFFTTSVIGTKVIISKGHFRTYLSESNLDARVLYGDLS